MRFKTRQELFSATDELKESFQSTHNTISHTTAQARLYFEGKQWEGGAFSVRNRSSTNLGKKQITSIYDPDRHDLRVTDNFITPLMIRLSAQTYPSSIEIEVSPSDAAATSGDMRSAQSSEDLLNITIDSSSYLQARRAANFGRTVVGDYGVGLALNFKKRHLVVNGKPIEVIDRVLRAFAFPPTALILDPFESSPDLRDHDIVIHNEVWTIHRIRREFGSLVDSLDVEKLKTVGELSAFEMATNRYSGGVLFAHHARHSRTKGAVVMQTHVKGESGRFGEMYVSVDGGQDGGKVWINEQNPVSPFGGDGLPLGLLHSNRRSESPWSISDLWLVVDDQNRRNVLKTLTYRHVQKHSAFNWIVNKRWFGTDKESIRNQLTNRVGGIIVGEGGDPRQGIAPPALVQMPAPSPIITDLADREQVSAMEKVSRPEVSIGRTKSHVPDSTFQTAIEQANQIGGVRIQEDVELDSKMLMVVLGTQLKAIRSGSPSILGSMRTRGFEPEDISGLLGVIPNDPQVRIRVRQTSVRNRSNERRKSDLDSALQLQAITPQQYRRSLAVDLDIPLMQEDKYRTRNASRSAERILLGEDWVPIPLGDDTETFLSAFRDAMFDRRTRKDEQASVRLRQALQSQLFMQAQEAQLLAQASGQGQQQQPQGQQTQQTPQPQPGDSVTLADLLQQPAALSA